jgi:prepilin-type N-terminal cleavage/methylation domain-containing protein
MYGGKRIRASGFSLLELLFVLAIIVTLTAIALPNLMNARRSAEEVAAEETLRTINYAAEVYRLAYGSYPASLKHLGPPTNNEKPTWEKAGLLDWSLVRGIKNGYRIVYLPLALDTNGNANDFLLVAVPERAYDDRRQLFCSSTRYTFRADCQNEKLIQNGVLIEE